MAVRLKDRIEANIRQSDKVNSSLSINGKTFNGSQAVDVGTIGAAYGGTGQTTLVNSANALINALGVGTSTPIDQDYYISQTVGGGTTSTICNRRPHSALYSYIKNKAEGTWGISITGSATKATQDGNGNTISSTYLPLAGGNITGILRVYNAQNNGFFLHRNSGNEAVRHYLDDSQYILEYTNDETSNSIVFKFINTDMETNAGANPSSAQITFACSNTSKTTITANNFAGNASTATSASIANSIKDSGDGRTLYMNYSAAGMTSTSWLGSWNGNTLQSIAPSVLNVGSATKLQTARKINSVSFNGTSDITFQGSYTTATDASSLPAGLSFIELPATPTSTGDPTYGVCFTAAINNCRTFQIGITNSGKMYTRGAHTNHTTTNVAGYSNWTQVWRAGDSVTGAVWNDYAEYRESDCQEFGRVLVENGDDSLSISNFRLQPFAGVSSDTWGFCQGETEKAKTPIAVAGRVLVYPYQDRENYKPGDCVCAAPNGTVDIMTRQEVIQYPDRIVGTVSCIPNYEEWGQGDRPAVKVDGRIWIKVR